MGLTGASLAAALPGAILAVIMLRAVLGAINTMPVAMAVVSIALLVVSGAVAFLPAYLLVWYRGAPVPERPKSPTEDSTGAVATGDLHEQDEAFAASDDINARVNEAFEESQRMPEPEPVEDEESFEEYGDELSAGVAEEEFDGAEFGEDSFDESFEFEDFEEDEK